MTAPIDRLSATRRVAARSTGGGAFTAGLLALVAAVGLTGCADRTRRHSRTPGDRVAPTCNCGSITATRWNGSATGFWEPGAKTMALVLHPAATERDAASFYAWVVADATKVRAVYLVPRAQFGQFLDAAARSLDTASTPGDKASWGIAGGIAGPGPGGPGPVG